MWGFLLIFFFMVPFFDTTFALAQIPTLTMTATPNASALIGQLQDPKTSVQNDAMNVYLTLGPQPDYVASLIDAAQKGATPTLRVNAITVLSYWRAPEGLPVLIQLLKDPDAQVAYQACFALSLYRDAQATDGLIQLYEKSKETFQKNLVIRKIANIKDPKALDFVRARLKDKDPNIRAAAANGLAEAGDISGRLVALGFLKNHKEVDGILIDSIIAIGDCKNPKDLPLLEKLGEKPGMTPFVRDFLKEGLYLIRSTKMTESDKIDALTDYLYNKNTDPSLRVGELKFAAKQLVLLGTPAAMDVLNKATQDKALYGYWPLIINFMRVAKTL